MLFEVSMCITKLAVLSNNNYTIGFILLKSANTHIQIYRPSSRFSKRQFKMDRSQRKKSKSKFLQQQKALG